MADQAETIKKTVDTAADTIKATTDKARAQAETMQVAGAKAFREGVEKSVAGMSELNTQGKQNLEALTASAAAAQKGAEALTNHAIAFSKKSFEDGVAAAQQMSGARSVQELIELQTTWAKSASEAYLSEMTRATEILTASVKDTFQPLNARVAASVEKFQAVR